REKHAKPRRSPRSLLSQTHPCNLLSEFHASMAENLPSAPRTYHPAPHLEDALAPAASRILQGRLPCLRGPSGNCFTPSFHSSRTIAEHGTNKRIRRQHPPGRVFNLS